jgi:tetratricopeptide (TPR) repeat protein
MVYYCHSIMSDNTVHIGSDKANAWQQWRKKRIIWISLTVLIVLVAGIVVLRLVHDARRPNTAGAGQLKSLQKNLQVAMDGANSQGVVDLVGGILSGQAVRTFTVTDAQLSMYHLDRASAYLNLKQYKNAVADYEQAITLNGTNTLAALQGEVEARYKLGDRQQLIPVYQQMIQLDSNSQNPMRGSDIAQYQDNIQTLQQGGELQFE